MRSDVVSENERLLRETEERLRQRRAAMGIKTPSGPSERASSAGPAAAPPTPEQAPPQADESSFTQDMQDSHDPLELQDLNGHRREPADAGAAHPVQDLEAELDEDPDEVTLPETSLPLDRYVEEAGRAEVEWMDRQVGETTGSVDWKAGWHFVRLLKCHPELRDLKTLDALRKARAAIVRASKRRPSYRDSPGAAFNEVIGEFLAENTDEFDAHFMRNWKAIRHLPGESPLETAVRLANRFPLGTLSATDGSLAQYRKLVSLAGWLQYVVGDRNIFLPVHKLGPLLGCSARSVSSYIAMAKEEEILERVKAHALATRKAHEFRFRTERWKILTEGPP